MSPLEAPSSPPAADACYTVADLARLFHCHTGTIHNWRRQGRLPAPIRLGKGKYFWTAAAIQLFLNQQGGAA